MTPKLTQVQFDTFRRKYFSSGMKTVLRFGQAFLNEFPQFDPTTNHDLQDPDYDLYQCTNSMRAERYIQNNFVSQEWEEQPVQE